MLALAHLKFVIARGWCQSGFFQIGFQSLNPLNQLFWDALTVQSGDFLIQSGPHKQ